MTNTNSTTAGTAGGHTPGPWDNGSQVCSVHADKASAITEAFRISHGNGIAAYAIETREGWIASERKPSLRYGKVFECLYSGELRHG